MDPKEIKALLKEAREAIKKHEHQTVLRCCKAVIKKDPENYYAIVYLGAALLELGKTQQSLESYKKATQIDPKNLLAWQGIIKFYEKQGIKCHPDLLDAYKVVATHYEKDDRAKYIESTMKLANALVSQKENKSALKVLVRLSKSVGLTLEIASLAVQLLNPTKSTDRTPDQNNLYTLALETIINEKPQPSEEIFRKYYAQLNRAEEYEKLCSYCLKVQDKWNRIYSPMEWICRLYLEEKLVVPKDVEIMSMDLLTDKLFKLHPSSYFGYFARGKYLISCGKHFEALDWLNAGLESNYNLHAVDLCIGINMEFENFQCVYDQCNECLKKIEKSADLETKVKFRLNALEALIELDVNSAHSFLEQLQNDQAKNEWSPESVAKLAFLAAKMYTRVSKFGQIKSLIGDMEKSPRLQDLLGLYQILCQLDTERPQDIVEPLITYADQCLCQSHVFLEMAKVVYLQKLYSCAAELYVKACESEWGAIHPVPWKYLGLMYKMQEKWDSAKRCFAKSFELNPNKSVGLLLSDVYFSLNLLTEEHKDHLIAATKVLKANSSQWAWIRLGMLHLHTGAINEAINCLQFATRTPNPDPYMLESLADAYFTRGSLRSALKCYEAAFAAGADPLYSKLRIGTVYQLVGEEEQAINCFSELLKSHPKYEPLLVELSKTYFRKAVKSIEDLLSQSAITAAQEAIDYAVRIILYSEQSTLFPWLVVGDLAIALSTLAPSTSIKIPRLLLGGEMKDENFNQAMETVTLEKLLEIGAGCISQCLKLTENELKSKFSSKFISHLYEKLARAYYLRSKIKGIVNKEGLLTAAFTASSKAVSANENSYFSWNTLGIIAMALGKNPLAQHGFLKSLHIESTAIAWCNLGIFYLKNDSFMLAHKAFCRAQAADPTHSTSWAGQGLVAEVLQPKEAMDLFRHACDLKPTSFSIVAYGEWVCRTLVEGKDQTRTLEYMYNITHCDAINTASDLLGQIIGKCNSPSVYNCQGILYGWNGLKNSSFECFSLALEENAQCNTLVPESEHKLRVNKIAVMIDLQLYSEALEEIQELNFHGPEVIAFAALCSEKLGDLAKAEALFTNVIETSSSERLKSDAVIASALLACEANDIDRAKPLLFHECIQSNPYGLLTVCSIALILGDISLIEQVLEHLKAFESDWDSLPGIALMRTYAAVLKETWSDSLKYVLNLIHRYPTNASFWNIAAHSILSYDHDHKYQPSVPRQLLLSAKKVLAASSDNEISDSDDTSPATLSFAYLLEGDWRMAKRTALKTARCYPSDRGSWAVLAFALWLEYCETKEKSLHHLLAVILQKEISFGQCTPRLLTWTQLFLEEILNH